MKIPELVRQSIDLLHRVFEAERFAGQNLLAFLKCTNLQFPQVIALWVFRPKWL